MAQVTTTITPECKPYNFTGVLEPQVTRTGLSRAEHRHIAIGESVAATGAGDNQYLVVSAVLDNQWAYALHDISLAIQAATGGTVNFPDVVDLRIVDTTAGGSAESLRFNIPMVSPGTALTSNGVGQKIYYPAQEYHGLLVNEQDGTPQLRITAYNTTANDIAYSVTFSSRLLVFDREQALSTSANSAIAVR